jgi:hypothetical protein
MKTLTLEAKARQLWHGRNEFRSVWFYLRRNAVRHCVMTVIFDAVIAATWWSQWQTISLGLFGFWLGRLMRDLAWYRGLSAEWPTTAQLLDWTKIESLAT